MIAVGRLVIVTLWIAGKVSQTHATQKHSQFLQFGQLEFKTLLPYTCSPCNNCVGF